MANKNIPRKSVRSHLFLEASLHESHLAIQENDKPAVSVAFEFDVNHIMSRRPTRLSLELLSRAKGKRPLPEAEENILEAEELLKKYGSSQIDRDGKLPVSGSTVSYRNGSNRYLPNGCYRAVN